MQYHRNPETDQMWRRESDSSEWELLPTGNQPVVQSYRTQLPASDPLSLPPSAATQHVQLATTYVDRSKGFQLATLPIAAAFGLGVLLIAYVGFDTPFLSVSAFVVFWLAFLAWWLVGWLIHHAASPDGNALIHTLLGWRYLNREQKERHQYYRGRP